VRAIRVFQTGDASVLQIQGLPQTKPTVGRALIRLGVAGLNFADVYYLTGAYAVTDNNAVATAVKRARPTPLTLLGSMEPGACLGHYRPGL
jgi:NADPH:quinone reductase-like Zn-dependent oxidoreductase